MGAYVPGIIFTCMLSVILILHGRAFRSRKKCTVVIRGSKPQFAPVQDIFRSLRGITVQSKNIFGESFEVVYEMRVNPKVEENVLMRLNGIEGLSDVNVLAPETKAA